MPPTPAAPENRTSSATRRSPRMSCKQAVKRRGPATSGAPVTLPVTLPVTPCTAATGALAQIQCRHASSLLLSSSRALFCHLRRNAPSTLRDTDESRPRHARNAATRATGLGARRGASPVAEPRTDAPPRAKTAARRKPHPTSDTQGQRRQMQKGALADALKP